MLAAVLTTPLLAQKAEKCGLGRMKMERLFRDKASIETWFAPSDTLLAKDTILASQTFLYSAKVFRLKGDIPLSPASPFTLSPVTDVTMWRTKDGVLPCAFPREGGPELVCLLEPDGKGRYHSFGFMDPQGYWSPSRKVQSLPEPAEIYEDLEPRRRPAMYVTRQLKIKSVKKDRLGYMVLGGMDYGRGSAPARSYDTYIQDENTIRLDMSAPQTIEGYQVKFDMSDAGVKATVVNADTKWSDLLCGGSRVDLGYSTAAHKYGYSFEIEVE